MKNNFFKKPPITLKDKSESEYLEPNEPILLHKNGDVSCGKILYKYQYRFHCKHHYGYISEYLNKNKLPLNISNFKRKSLYDIIEELHSEHKKTISLEKLLDIAGPRNAISEIRKNNIARIERYAYRKHFKDRFALFDSGDDVRIKEFEEEFKRKKEIVHKIKNP